jgi:transposase
MVSSGIADYLTPGEGSPAWPPLPGPMVSPGIADFLTLSATNAVNAGIDMGNRRWDLVVHFYRTGKRQRYCYKGKDCKERCIEKVRELAVAGHAVNVTYEIGRDGFDPARRLSEIEGVTVNVLPVNRLHIVCSGKQVKTDGVDADFVTDLDPRVMPKLPSVWVPEVDVECRRRALREKQRLDTSIKRVNNQLISILKRWPVSSIDVHQPAADWTALLEEWNTNGDTSVPRMEQGIMANMIEELEVFEKNQHRWEQILVEEEERQRQQARAESRYATFEILRQYRGIGEEISRYFDWYVGDLARFGNGKRFASYLGLTPTPFSSGSMQRDQGISKKGNKELRRLMIQLAWLWVKWQPDSALVRKWRPRLAQRGRHRKTAIVALARQLCVAFHRLIIYGEPLEGALMNAPLEPQ